MKVLSDLKMNNNNLVDANVTYYDPQVIQDALEGYSNFTGLNASTVQEAIDLLFQIVLPTLNLIGGSPNTENSGFIAIVDGGKPSTENFNDILDGGLPSDNNE